MDVTIFDNKKIRYSIGAEGSLLLSKNEADIDAIVDALEKAQTYFYNGKTLKNKDLVNRVFEIHYKYIRVIFQLHNTFIEVSNILNIHAFPPNGNPVYEDVVNNISQEQRLKNAAMLLLKDYENDKELTDLTLIDSDDFYAYETK